MRFRVYIEPPALGELDAVYLGLRKFSARAADVWLDGMQDAIDAIARMPSSYAISPEASRFGMDIREMHYGKSPQVYRVFFVVKKHRIHVLHVRHAAQRSLTRPQLVDLQTMPLSKRRRR